MNLIDKYIQEVTRRLPEKNRKDIALELRSTIEDMLPKQYSEEEVKEVLKELGNPAILANGYNDRPIGIRIPNVPHEVPVAKESPIATIKSIAGRKICTVVAFSTSPATNVPASRKFVIVFKVHAKVRIRIAGTICLNPSEIESIHSVKLSTRRQIK